MNKNYVIRSLCILAIVVLWIIYQANHVYKGRLKSFRDGSEYIGSIKNNMPFGEGKLIRPDGSVWKGNFNDWSLTGHYTVTLEGATCTGAFVYGLLNGQ